MAGEASPPAAGDSGAASSGDAAGAGLAVAAVGGAGAPPEAAAAAAAGPGGADDAAAKHARHAERRATRHAVVAGRPCAANTVRALTGLVYVLTVAAAVAVIYQLAASSAERHVIAWGVAAIFVGLAVPLSMHEIAMHVLDWRSPMQVYYVRIHVLVPLYGIESWLALRFRDQAIYFTVTREIYESIVIRDFFALMMDALSGGSGDLERASATLAKGNPGRDEAHIGPAWCCRRGWPFKGGVFLARTRATVFQFVVIRIVLAVAVFLAEFTHKYEEGDYSWSYLYVYTVVIINVSQCVALWGLVLLYHESAAVLEPLTPLLKFLAIKGVVFFSFWQGVLLAGLVSVGYIQATADYTASEVSSGLQDFLICLEMAAFAVAHHYVFSVRDFTTGLYKSGPLADAGGEAGHAAAAAPRVLHLLGGDVVAEAGQHAALAAAAAGAACAPGGACGPGARTTAAVAPDAVELEAGFVPIDGEPGPPPAAARAGGAGTGGGGAAEAGAGGEVGAGTDVGAGAGTGADAAPGAAPSRADPGV